MLLQAKGSRFTNVYVVDLLKGGGGLTGHVTSINLILLSLGTLLGCVWELSKFEFH